MSCRTFTLPRGHMCPENHCFKSWNIQGPTIINPWFLVVRAMFLLLFAGVVGPHLHQQCFLADLNGITQRNSMKQHWLWALIGHRNRKQHIKYIWYHKVIWRFPKMGEHPKSSNFNRLFHYEPAVGVPPSAPVPAPREGPIALQLLWPTTCLPASGQQKRWDFEGPSLGTSHFMKTFSLAKQWILSGSWDSRHLNTEYFETTMKSVVSAPMNPNHWPLQGPSQWFHGAGQTHLPIGITGKGGEESNKIIIGIKNKLFHKEGIFTILDPNKLLIRHYFWY